MQNPYAVCQIVRTVMQRKGMSAGGSCMLRSLFYGFLLRHGMVTFAF